MTDKNESRILRLVYYAVPILLIVYVASIGPVVGSVQTPQGTPLEYVPLLTAFYAPVMWVIDRDAFLEELVRRYIAFYSPDF
tara:strand:- start:7266 stop:7511 length:246 start_codon:yes stop_codon:yes gene_type:complete